MALPPVLRAKLANLHAAFDADHDGVVSKKDLALLALRLAAHPRATPARRRDIQSGARYIWTELFSGRPQRLDAFLARAADAHADPKALEAHMVALDAVGAQLFALADADQDGWLGEYEWAWAVTALGVTDTDLVRASWGALGGAHDDRPLGPGQFRETWIRFCAGEGDDGSKMLLGAVGEGEDDVGGAGCLGN